MRNLTREIKNTHMHAFDIQIYTHIYTHTCIQNKTSVTRTETHTYIHTYMHSTYTSIHISANLSTFKILCILGLFYPYSIIVHIFILSEHIYIYL